MKAERKNLSRSRSGSQIAEFGASLILVIPLFMAIVYLTYQMTFYMYLKSSVDAAARTEARWLAINFDQYVQANGNSAANYAQWKNNNVRVANCVTSASQFMNGTIDSAGNFVTTAPAVISTGGCLSGASGRGAVAVRVIYPGDTGLPSWPNPPVTFFSARLTPNNYTIAAVSVVDIEP